MITTQYGRVSMDGLFVDQVLSDQIIHNIMESNGEDYGDYQKQDCFDGHQ